MNSMMTWDFVGIMYRGVDLGISELSGMPIRDKEGGLGEFDWQRNDLLA